MPKRIPAKRFQVHVERIITSRHIFEVLAANELQAGKLAIRELEAGKLQIPDASWKPRRAEFKSVFVHSPEAEVSKLAGYEGP